MLELIQKFCKFPTGQIRSNDIELRFFFGTGTMAYQEQDYLISNFDAGLQGCKLLLYAFAIAGGIYPFSSGPIDLTAIIEQSNGV